MAWSWRGRGGIYTGPWPGRGPFSYLPPWQRPGWFLGLGRGFGTGMLWSVNPYACARFPWLPRWWWAYSQFRYRHPSPYIPYNWGSWLPWSFYGISPYAYAYTAYPYPHPPAPYMEYW